MNLLTVSYGTYLYSITLQDISTPNPICLMAKATSSQAWLWHRRLSHLNFDTINLLSKNDIMIGLPKLKFVKDHLCSLCELGKAKRKSFHTKTTSSSKRQLQTFYNGLKCPMRVESINKKYVLVNVDDYSKYTWTSLLSFCPFHNVSTTSIEQDSLGSDTQSQENVTQTAKTITMSNELDFLFSPMFDELLNGTTPVVSKSSVVHAVDAPDKRQHQNITHSSTTTVFANAPPLNIHTTPQSTNQAPTQVPTSCA
ncbi:retrovirus-related pol polyprotein from transposon TNT 1-94 [Tanacetum coccineum]